MKIEEILIVRHDKVCFGIPTYLIGQILRVPEMTSLVLSPKEVHGVCAVGGNITTAVDMNLLLGVEKADLKSQKSRILTLNGEFSASALVVSEVMASVLIDPENIEYTSDPQSPIVAIYHHGDELIQVVGVGRILSAIRPIRAQSKEITEKHEAMRMAADQNTQNSRYLLFRMGNEMYALGIEHLREILGASQAITPLTGTAPEVLGMMSLREELVLIFDLRRYFDFEPRKSDKNRILVTQMQDKVLGLMIDEIIDIKEFSSAQIDRFIETEERGKAAGVIHDGENLISLVGSEAIRGIIRQCDSLIIPSGTVTDNLKTDIVCEVVVFKLGNEEYAIHIERVAEIIDMTPVTPVAQAPEMVEGVVNIRGQIVTIGSLHRRLKIDPSKDADQKIIICDTPKGRVGFFVDGVSDVMGVRSDEVHEENDPRSLFSHILHFEKGKRLVMLLDFERAYGV